jgi:hypothetical protein
VQNDPPPAGGRPLPRSHAERIREPRRAPGLIRRARKKPSSPTTGGRAEAADRDRLASDAAWARAYTSLLAQGRRAGVG